MPDWKQIIEGVGTFLEGASNGVIINQWLEVEEVDALNNIEEFVRRASSTQIDSMDSSLLHIAHFHLDSEKRLQLIKYYAFFKLVEFNRFQEWRGFPKT